jgi:hypothetical protein
VINKLRVECESGPLGLTDENRTGPRGPAALADAVLLLKAAHIGDVDEADRILSTSAVRPLLTGMTACGLALGEMAADDDPARFQLVLERLARRFDGADASGRIEVNQ